MKTVPDYLQPYAARIKVYEDRDLNSLRYRFRGIMEEDIITLPDWYDPDLLTKEELIEEIIHLVFGKLEGEDPAQDRYRYERMGLLCDRMMARRADLLAKEVKGRASELRSMFEHLPNRSAVFSAVCTALTDSLGTLITAADDLEPHTEFLLQGGEDSSNLDN